MKKPADQTLVQHVADVMKANMGNNIAINDDEPNIIYIESISTNVIHKITFERIE